MQKYKEFVNVQPIINVVGNNLKNVSNLEFIYSQPPNVKVTNQLQSSYLTFTLVVTGAAIDISALANDLASNAGLCSNPSSVLIKNSQYYVNDKKISDISDFVPFSYTDKLLNSNQQVEQSSFSPLLMHSNDSHVFTNTSNIPLTAFNQIFQISDQHMNTRIRNENCMFLDGDNAEINKNKVAVNGTNIRLLFAMDFPHLVPLNEEQEVDIYGNIKHSLRLQINSYAQNRLFVGLTPDQINAITVSFKKVEWVIETYQSENIPMQISYKIPYNEAFVHSVEHKNTLYTVNIPSSSHLVSIYFSFSEGSRQGTELIDTVIGSAGRMRSINAALLNAANVIKNIYINFQGKNYDMNALQLLSNENEISNCDIQRSYYNYKRVCKAHQSGEPSLLNTPKKFFENPLYCWEVKSTENTTTGSSQLTIYIDSDPSAYPANIGVKINVVAFYEKELQVVYNEFSQVTDLGVYVRA
jgi:hypothetical protein